jgi:hypothetical protein
MPMSVATGGRLWLGAVYGLQARLEHATKRVEQRGEHKKKEMSREVMTMPIPCPHPPHHHTHVSFLHVMIVFLKCGQIGSFCFFLHVER